VGIYKYNNSGIVEYEGDTYDYDYEIQLSPHFGALIYPNIVLDFKIFQKNKLILSAFANAGIVATILSGTPFTDTEITSSGEIEPTSSDIKDMYGDVKQKVLSVYPTLSVGAQIGF